jgi:hypothetical protein
MWEQDYKNFMLDTERGTQNEIETLIKNLSTMKKMNMVE